MRITFMEWLYNREMFSCEGQTAIPHKDELVSFKGNIYKVVLVKHVFDLEGKRSAIVEIEHAPMLEDKIRG